jgi:ABC-2 type transport system permease protein
VILTIAGKELRRLFASPLGWVILAFLQFIFALFFVLGLRAFIDTQAQMAMLPGAPGFTAYVVEPSFGAARIFLLMVLPLLSMRLIAEERRNQTLPFLLSAPVSITEVVLGKFLGLLAFLALPVGLLALMALSLYLGGKLDLGLLASNVLGSLLLSGSFAVVGLYLSSLTSHPLVAGVGTYALLLLLWLINAGTADPDSPVHMLSLIRHYDAFAKGTVAISDVVYYVVLIVLFLLLCIRRLDADRVRT